MCATLGSWSRPSTAHPPSAGCSTSCGAGAGRTRSTRRVGVTDALARRRPTTPPEACHAPSCGALSHALAIDRLHPLLRPRGGERPLSLHRLRSRPAVASAHLPGPAGGRLADQLAPYTGHRTT